MIHAGFDGSGLYTFSAMSPSLYPAWIAKKAFYCLRNEFSDQVTYVIVNNYVVLLPNSGSNSMLASLNRSINILVKSRFKNVKHTSY